MSVKSEDYNVYHIGTDKYSTFTEQKQIQQFMRISNKFHLNKNCHLDTKGPNRILENSFIEYILGSFTLVLRCITSFKNL